MPGTGLDGSIHHQVLPSKPLHWFSSASVTSLYTNFKRVFLKAVEWNSLSHFRTSCLSCIFSVVDCNYFVNYAHFKRIISFIYITIGEYSQFKLLWKCLDIALNISLLVALFISGGTHINGAGRSHSRRISGLKTPFPLVLWWSFFLTYKDMFGPLSIQECVFYLTVFINPMCFPLKELNVSSFHLLESGFMILLSKKKKERSVLWILLLVNNMFKFSNSIF